MPGAARSMSISTTTLPSTAQRTPRFVNRAVRPTPPLKEKKTVISMAIYEPLETYGVDPLIPFGKEMAQGWGFVGASRPSGRVHPVTSRQLDAKFAP